MGAGAAAKRAAIVGLLVFYTAAAKAEEKSADQAATSNLPQIDSVDLSEDEDGASDALVVVQEIKFHAPDGDAVTVRNQLVSSSPGAPNVGLRDGTINIPVERQQAGAIYTMRYSCVAGRNDYSLTKRFSLVNSAGSAGNSVDVTINCRSLMAVDGKKSNAHVTITPDRNGLHVVFELGAPVDRFYFLRSNLLDPHSRTESNYWHMLTPGLTLKNGIVAAAPGATFQTFEITVSPGAPELDRIYPPLFRVGPDGWGLYATYFLGNSALYNTTLAYELSSGFVVSSGNTPVGVDKVALRGDGYVYLGPKTYMSGTGATLIIPPDVPSGIAAQVEPSSDAIIKIYRDKLGLSLPEKPTIIVSYTPGPPSFWKGDTTPGEMMALRIRGEALSATTGLLQVIHFIAHETFHYWNGELFSPPAENWLHEGSADYAAFLVSRQLGLLSEDEFAKDVGSDLTTCRDSLQVNTLDSQAGASGQAPYACGVVIQWVTDVVSRRNSEGTHDFYTIWRNMFKATAKDHHYTVSDFLRAAIPPEQAANVQPIIDLLISREGRDRWDELPGLLAKAGIQITLIPDIAKIRGTALMHLLSQNCKGSYGFYNSAQGPLKLDTTTNCGSLNGDPQVTAIEGFDLFTHMPEAWAAEEKKCAAGLPVTLVRNDGASMAAACHAPMPPAPNEAFAVVNTYLGH